MVDLLDLSALLFDRYLFSLFHSSLCRTIFRTIGSGKLSECDAEISVCDAEIFLKRMEGKRAENVILTMGNKLQTILLAPLR